MISTELLSKVLNFPFNSITDIQYDNNLLLYTTYSLPTHKYKEINIYELAHKCKEWAFKEGFVVQSNINNQGAYAIINDTGEIFHIQADTELKAIFKACEWILEQQGNI